MANNVTLPGTGNIVETIDEGGGLERQVVTIGGIGSTGSGETQVTTVLPVQDATANNNAGSMISWLTSIYNALLGNQPTQGIGLSDALPTSDIALVAAQSSDAPIFTAITGDPNGDFKNVNLLEAVIDDSTLMNIKVQIVNPPKVDPNGATIISDAPTPIIVHGIVGENIIIDTTGYTTLNITTAAMAGAVTCSSDGITWSALSGMTAAAAISAGTVAATTAYSFPCFARWIRFVPTTAGYATIYLRSGTFPAVLSGATLNVSQWNGSTVVSGGVAGTIAVGGNIAPGAAPTANPVLVGGVDSGTPGTLLGVPLTRRLLTDNQGRVKLAEELPQSFQNTPIIAVDDVSVSDGKGDLEIFTQILQELRINNHLLHELPSVLNQVLQNSQLFQGQNFDDPQDLRNDQTLWTD